MSTSERGAGDEAFEALLRDLSRAPAVSLADLDLTGRALGRFEVRRRIGAGGMGAVYEAWDTRLLRVVALKVLHAWKGAGGDPAARLTAEARRAAAMSHPSIAAVYDVDTVDGITFLAGERIDGRSLDRVLAAGRLPAGEALRVARRIAAALACAHRAGIVHRDLTPANVMIGVDGAVKLLDFGIATTSASSAGGPTGTPGYMAPEQAAGGPVDARSDVFSFGVLLRAMLPRAPRPGSEALVDEARRLADRCAARDPRDRPADGGALVAALRSIGHAPRPAPSPRPIGRWIAAVIALPLLAGIALLPGAPPRAALAPPAKRVEIAELRPSAPLPRPLDGKTAPVSTNEQAANERARPAPAGDEASLDDPPAIGDPPAIAADRGDPAEPPVELPMTVYLDAEGRLVTIADLRGADIRRASALGDLVLRAAPGGSAGLAPTQRHGTLGVSAGPGGTLRITVEIEPSGRALAAFGETGSVLDPGGSHGSRSNGTSSSGIDPGVGAGSALNKGVALGGSAASEGDPRGWFAALCGVPFDTALSIRLLDNGTLEITKALTQQEGVEPPLAVIDPLEGLLHAGRGVALCDRQDGELEN